MMKPLLLSLFLHVCLLARALPEKDSLPGPVEISGKLLYAVRSARPFHEWEKRLEEMDPGQLRLALAEPSAAMAFWLNLYNAFTRLALQQDPASFTKRGRFFRTKRFRVAGQQLSLDDIEHGILRRSAIKWRLGYLKNPFPGTFEKRFRLRRTDPRIHFALNCGAKSCPPIAYYQPDRLHQQLETASRNYLQQEVHYDTLSRELRIPQLFNWFRGDFGGKKKIYRMLEKYQLIPAGSRPAIRYSQYNWDLYLAPETETE